MRLSRKVLHSPAATVVKTLSEKQSISMGASSIHRDSSDSWPGATAGFAWQKGIHSAAMSLGQRLDREGCQREMFLWTEKADVKMTEMLLDETSNLVAICLRSTKWERKVAVVLVLILFYVVSVHEMVWRSVHHIADQLRFYYSHLSYSTGSFWSAAPYLISTCL